jgi:hypothetical protein
LKKTPKGYLRGANYPKAKQWQVDQDYVDKLSPEEQEWLARFNKEYYAGRVKKGDPDAHHKTDKQRQDCYSRQNSVNRDILNRGLRQDTDLVADPTDALIELIDLTKTPKR